MRRAFAWFLFAIGLLVTAAVTIATPFDSWGDPPHLRRSVIPELILVACLAMVPNLAAVILALSAKSTRRSAHSMILAGFASTCVAIGIVKIAYLQSLLR